MIASATLPPALIGPIEVQWYLDGVPYGDLQVVSGEEASLNLGQLSHGSHALTLTCSGPGLDTPMLAEMSGPIIVNSPPLLPRFGFGISQYSPCLIPLLGLLDGIRDPDGDKVQVVEIQPRSALGAVVTRIGDSLVYDPVPGSTGVDTISYVAADPLDGRTSGVISVQLHALSNTAKISVAEDRVDVTFSSAPNKAFVVETTGDLHHWTTLTTLSGDQPSYRLDTVQRGGDFSRFYRVRFP